MQDQDQGCGKIQVKVWIAILKYSKCSLPLPLLVTLISPLLHGLYHHAMIKKQLPN